MYPPMNRTDQMNHAMQQMTRMMSKSFNTILFSMVIVVIAVIGLLTYFSIQNGKKSANNKKMFTLKEKYPPKMSSINPSDGQHQYALRDYYILTSYNSCCGGDYANDYVSREALETVIEMGARCLDFEIYLVDGRPVVGASTKDSIYLKQTYNAIPFADAMQIVADKAFTDAPNPRDPLLLVFRIKSNQLETYNKMATILENTLASRMLGPEYAYESRGKDMGVHPLKDFMEKVIFVVDVSNPTYQQSKLEEFINIGANSPFLRMERSTEMVHTHDFHGLKEYNKKHMSYCMPDLSSTQNEHIDTKYNYGIQMVGLMFQHNDAGFEHGYTRFQGKQGFLLKPKEMRFVPNTIAPPKEQNPDVSYQPKQVQGRGYTITV